MFQLSEVFWEALQEGPLCPVVSRGIRTLELRHRAPNLGYKSLNYSWYSKKGPPAKDSYVKAQFPLTMAVLYETGWIFLFLASVFRLSENICDCVYWLSNWGDECKNRLLRTRFLGYLSLRVNHEP